VKDLSLKRNYCIIAHIDHGKSTLADRMLQMTHTVQDRDMREQLLDNMDLERERGITIKSHPVTMNYKARDGKTYEFNLIDTPGHVDFTYEVSRSMAACEGAILVVDAAQGVEAQTVANTYLAMDNDLEIITVLNKVDLPNADVKGVCTQVEEILAQDMSEPLLISAKTGQGIEDVMEAIIKHIPPPLTVETDKPRALVFDSVYDSYRGVISYIRVMEGEFKKGDKFHLMRGKIDSDIKEIGVFRPRMTALDKLSAGQVGYLIGSLKDPSEVKVGDTITLTHKRADEPLKGFKEIRPIVFSGLYPVDAGEYEKLKQNLDKLSLNDSAFSYQAETSVALGFGFRCGFLGLLHMEIIQERLRREYDMNLINTYPAVIYKVYKKDGTLLEVDNPVHMPDTALIDYVEEPIIKAYILCMNEHIGDIMRLVMDRRGEVEKTESIDTRRVMLTCRMPLNEILVDFHDILKSISKGYASVDYEHAGYEAGKLVKMDILLNGEIVDAFSCLIHQDKAQARGRQMCKALKDVIPPHMFSVPVQAAINGSIIARETIKAMRKDVTAKCYGGDITRKRKLLEKQKEGKKRMKQVGSVNVPQQAFISVLKNNTGNNT
jgi:GTP-binding protein LepA